MSESTKEPEVPVILDQRKGKFFIRESYLDEKDGSVHWVVSTINDEDSQHEFSIRVNRNNPNMGTIMRNLDGSIMDLSTLHLVKTSQSPENWEVASASEVMDPAKRAIMRKGERLSSWTPELGDSVEKYCEYRTFEKANEIKKDLYCSKEKMEPIKKRTEYLFAEKVAELLPDASDEDIALFTMEARQDDSVHRNGTLNDLVAGKELGPDGEIQRVFYNTDYPLAEQLGEKRGKESKLSAIYNYAAQASLSEVIRARICIHDTDTPPLLEDCENQLKRMKALVSTHPTRTKGDYEILTSEYAEMISGESVRAMMSACGAKSANPDYDDINIRVDTKLSGRGQDQTFGNEICREVIEKFQTNQKGVGDPFLHYLNTEGRSAYKFARKAKQDVEVAQDAAMAPGKKRIEKKDYSKQVDGLKKSAGTATKKVIDGISEMEICDIL